MVQVMGAESGLNSIRLGLPTYQFPIGEQR